jgi:hypothetical protein
MMVLKSVAWLYTYLLHATNWYSGMKHTVSVRRRSGANGQVLIGAGGKLCNDGTYNVKC